MNFTTPQEGKELIKIIQLKVEQLEIQAIEQELDTYFKEVDIYSLGVGDICYIAIYVDSFKGGIVKVRLDCKNGNNFHFTSVKNDILPELKEWNVVKRIRYPYQLFSNKIGQIWYISPIAYSNSDNCLNAKVLKARLSSMI